MLKRPRPWSVYCNSLPPDKISMKGSSSWCHKQSLHQTASLPGWPSPSQMAHAIPLSQCSSINSSYVPVRTYCIQVILHLVLYCSVSSINFNTWILLCSSITAHFVQDCKSVSIWHPFSTPITGLSWPYRQCFIAFGTYAEASVATRMTTKELDYQLPSNLLKVLKQQLRLCSYIYLCSGQFYTCSLRASEPKSNLTWSDIWLLSDQISISQRTNPFRHGHHSGIDLKIWAERCN